MLFCDMHGHSRTSNVFIYGCDDLRPENPNRLLARVFPALLGRACSSFSFKDCNFKIQVKISLYERCDRGHERGEETTQFGPADKSQSFHHHTQRRDCVFPREACENESSQSPIFLRAFSTLIFAAQPPQKSKSSTARVVVHKELGVMNSFTLEASFAGANRGVGAQARVYFRMRIESSARQKWQIFQARFIECNTNTQYSCRVSVNHSVLT